MDTVEDIKKLESILESAIGQGNSTIIDYFIDSKFQTENIEMIEKLRMSSILSVNLRLCKYLVDNGYVYVWKSQIFINNHPALNLYIYSGSVLKSDTFRQLRTI